MTFTGDGGHAGGQLMAVRNDAGLAAAELSLHVEIATLATGAGRCTAQAAPAKRGARGCAAGWGANDECYHCCSSQHHLITVEYMHC